MTSGFVVDTWEKSVNRKYRSAIDMLLFSKIQITVRILKFIWNKRPFTIFTTHSLDEKIWESMKWFGPKFWTIEKDFGEDQIALILMFLRSELNGSRSNAMSNIILYKSKQTNTVQGNILSYKRKEFPNLSLLAELVFALSGSNSSVERAINFFWTNVSRCRTRHAVLEMR